MFFDENKITFIYIVCPKIIYEMVYFIDKSE